MSIYKHKSEVQLVAHKGQKVKYSQKFSQWLTSQHNLEECLQNQMMKMEYKFKK